MKKGEESRQRLIACAARLFWKNGYAATGISEILDQAGLPKGSFYFYFKSKDELAVEVISYYQRILLDRLENISIGKNWEAFVDDAFAFLLGVSEDTDFLGCPFAVMGMETVFYKPQIAKNYREEIEKFRELFCRVLLFSGLEPSHAEALSGRFLSVYQGAILLGRISGSASYLTEAKNTMIEMYREYCGFHKLGKELL